jgi:hypothetical protein
MTADELRRLAEDTATSGNRRATFDALHELRGRGEPPDYLLDAARHHADDKWLAYHAIIVLGPDATDDSVWAVLRQVRDETSDAELLGAVALADRVRYLENTYGELTEPAEQIRYVLDTFRTEWNPISQSGGQVDRGTDPQAIWSQRKLHDLSEQHPEQTATAVATANREGLDETSTSNYRRFLASFMAEAAQAHFRLLDRGD